MVDGKIIPTKTIEVKLEINQVLKDRPPSNKSEPIESFLKSIKLDTYVQKFKENGFEELDILFDI